MGSKRKAQTQADGVSKCPKFFHDPRFKENDEPDWFSTPPEETKPLETAPVLSKRQLKKQKRAQDHREKKMANRLRVKCELPQMDSVSADPIVKSEVPSTSISLAVNPMPFTPIPPTIDPEPSLPFDVPLSLPRGYSTIKDLQEEDAKSRRSWLYTTAGVVHKISGYDKTGSGDLKRTIKLIDPFAHYLEPGDVYRDLFGFTINCFTKQYPEWLPQAQPGDVLILRSLKVQQYFNGNQGLGYSDKLEWACYSRSSGQIIRHTFSPSSAIVDGRNFSPFYSCLSEEIQYCRQLSIWWAGVQERVRKALGTVVDATQEGASGSPTLPLGRQHRLLRDVSPYIEPKGFFDCTVEILHTYDNPGYPTVRSVYVTDYTVLSHTKHVEYHGEWAGGIDSRTVLRIEMWDEAYVKSAEFQKGDIFSLKNIKMRENRDGNLEGKMSEANDRKITQVQESDGEYNDAVKAFFERRALFGRNNETAPELDYRSIEEFTPATHANTVVEILDIEVNADPPHMYVTDYSFRQELCKLKVSKPWAADLLGRVVQIVLEGTQIEIVKKMTPGSVVRIVSLRLKNRADGVFSGKLGGYQDLIRAVKEDGNTGSLEDAVDQLKQRRATFLSRRKRKIRELVTREGCNIIYDVLAKVVDVEPRSPREFVTHYCKGCENPLPRESSSCPTCNAHESVAKLFFGLKIEDEEGNTAYLGVEQDSKLLHDVDYTDLDKNQDTLEKFQNIFDPLIGNIDAGQGPLGGLYGIFSICCWEWQGKPGYSLHDIKKP